MKFQWLYIFFFLFHLPLMMTFLFVVTDPICPILFLSEIPVLLPLTFSSEYASEGDYVQLTCVASKGDQPMTFSWTLGGEPIIQTMGLSAVAVGRQTSLLIVQSVTFRHAGNYTCLASNDGGQARQSAELIVKGTMDVYICLAMFIKI